MTDFCSVRGFFGYVAGYFSRRPLPHSGAPERGETVFFLLYIYTVTANIIRSASRISRWAVRLYIKCVGISVRL